MSQEVFNEHAEQIDVAVGDILMVRDGTYLIGTVGMVADGDLPLLYQSHLLRFRSVDPSRLNRWALLAALSSPIVRRQVRAKQFTQDIIDTIGRRYRELRIPIPRDLNLRNQVEASTEEIVEGRAKLRAKSKQVGLLIQGIADQTDAGLEDLQDQELAEFPAEDYDA